MEEQHTPGRPADNVSDAELAELVKRVRKDHESRTAKQGWKIHSSALRRWRRSRRVGAG